MRQNIYDNESFAMQYDKMRKEQKGYNANDLIEIPNFRNLIPNVKGKRVLDLGCGYGENSRYCIENGALYVLGIDISKHMLDIANKENLVNGIEYVNMAMEDISQIDKKFDIVISSLAFHYIKDFKKLMKDIYNLLDENGTLVFSIDHPLRIASIFEPWMEKNYIELNGKWFLLVSDYQSIGSAIVWVTAELTVLCSGQYFVGKFVNETFPFKKIVTQILWAMPLGGFCYGIHLLHLSAILTLLIGGILIVVYYLFVNIYIFKNDIMMSLIHKVKLNR